ncbi:lantibiotic dehydratase [Streptomyces chartreusis]|uniref:Lantibiotic dehydratase n=2 Tax=Streptomyces chartreusis TaxID=1969 RepID=A0A7H8TPF4_STRCX|nr:lantibiotic dehydratase [Streptomyces chartreusis]
MVLVRAARHTSLRLPPWPDVTDESPARVNEWQSWLTAVWSMDDVAEVIEQASPALARRMVTLCSTDAEVEPRQVRRTLLSVIRYLQRMTGRATPNGLFAGVAVAGFGEPATRWGPWHRAVARAGSAWTSAVIEHLESVPDLLDRLPLLVNNSVFVRGERLVVPYPPQTRGGGRATAEITVRFTDAVQSVLDAAQTPVPFHVIVDKTAAQFPDVALARVQDLVASLVRSGVLVSSLHAPSTVVDALEHLVVQLESVDAQDLVAVAGLVADLRAVRDGLWQHNRALTPGDGRRLRRALHEKMTEIVPEDRPLTVDLRLDCSLVLPDAVAREAEKAATALARLTPMPFGTPGWKDFHTRFFEKYGIGSFVPLRNVIDPDIGLGFPAGYLDSTPEPRAALSTREQQLLALAQAAALDGRDEIRIDDELITQLRAADGDGEQPPPHFELTFQIGASSTEAMARGEFTLSGLRPSRGVGTVTGRFLPLLRAEDQDRFTSLLRDLPSNTPGALPAQLSFGPLERGDADVTRVPGMLPTAISLGEHRSAEEHMLGLDDLAVGCDRHRLYLVSLSRGCVVEPHIVHALDLRTHTPPLGRFLAEISRAQCSVLTVFPWGAADSLPFLPRVRYGRTVLSAARWLLHSDDLPGPTAPWARWHTTVEQWQERRHVPQAVLLTEGDQRLPLDLSKSAHRAVLRSHLARAGRAVLTEHAPVGDWLDGRAHEVVVAMRTTSRPNWPEVPAISATRLLSRDHGQLPGAPPWLLVKLYGHPERHPEILARHVTGLLSQWEVPPAWWFMRYRDPLPHLRLRIAVTDPDSIGLAVTRISEWAAGLRRSGLVNDVQFATTYPETGRWGPGPLMRLAEDIFVADSHTIAIQFAQPGRPGPRTLAAANFVSLASAFHGDVATAMTWLATYGATTDRQQRLDRKTLQETVRLADPTDNWAALRGQPGGTAIVEAWALRDEAIARYRPRLAEAGLDPQLVLDSLLHAHHLRAAGIDKDDERVCVRLARATASAWQARRKDSRGAT